MAADQIPDVYEWVKGRGGTSLVTECSFSDGLRGLVASSDLQTGDVCLEIPEAALIDIRIVLESSLAQALGAIGEFPEDWLLLVWTMVDRCIPDSEHAAFWRSMPENIITGLNANAEILQSLVGSAVYSEAIAARQHIAEQYDAMRPVLDALVRAYPTIISQEHVSHASYMWAVNLWYAYAMEIVGSDGKQRQTLVPLANIFNHSCRDAHVRQYGRVNTSNCTLKFPVCRPCKAGEQVFLSYGAISNRKLLLFYGFALADNPHETIDVKLPFQSDLVTLKASEESASLVARLIQNADTDESEDLAHERRHEEFIEAIDQISEKLQAVKRSLQDKSDASALVPDFALHAQIYVDGQQQICDYHRKQLETQE